MPTKPSFSFTTPGAAPVTNLGAGPVAGPSGPLKRKALHQSLPAQQQQTMSNNLLASQLPPGVSPELFLATIAFLKNQSSLSSEIDAIIDGDLQVPAAIDVDMASESVALPQVPIDVDIDMASVVLPQVPVSARAASPHPDDVPEIIEVDGTPPPPSLDAKDKSRNAPGPPPAPKNAADDSAPHMPNVIQNVRMLTGTLGNPSTAYTVSARDTVCRGLEVGALLIQGRTERGLLAQGQIRLWVDHKAATDEDLFPIEELVEFVRFVRKCVFPSFTQMDGIFDGDLPAEALPGYIATSESEALTTAAAGRTRGRPRKVKATEEQSDSEYEPEDEKAKKKNNKQQQQQKKKQQNANKSDSENEDDKKKKKQQQQPKKKAKAQAALKTEAEDVIDVD